MCMRVCCIVQAATPKLTKTQIRHCVIQTVIGE